jgi:hypothetical protein
MGKVPWGLSTTLKDQAVVQYRIGEAQATLMAVRAFVMDTQDRLEAHLGPLPSKGGRLIPDWEYFWPALLTCAHAAQTCREVVSRINNTCPQQKLIVCPCRWATLLPPGCNEVVQ